MVGKRRKDRGETIEEPVDLASRIGMAGAPEPVAAAPEPVQRVEPVRRVDGPIEAARGRPLLIGANEPPPPPIPARKADPPVEPAVILDADPEAPVMEYAPLTATVREAPLAGEMDLVVTPLPTPDDWHHFELALRRVRGVGVIRTEYYRAGILKLRVQWSGADRFAVALATVPGYRVGILGEDRSTVQIRVGRA